MSHTYPRLAQLTIEVPVPPLELSKNGRAQVSICTPEMVKLGELNRTLRRCGYTPEHDRTDWSSPVSESYTTIPLSRGQHAIIDSDDFPLLSKFTWFAQPTTTGFYAVSTARDDAGRYEKIYMHRLVMGVGKGSRIDHKNRDGLDNRKENLRIVTASQNAANSKLPSTNTTGYRGVVLRKDRKAKRYRAEITVNQQLISLGSFSTAEEAALVWDIAARKYFGEFASLNFPLDEDLRKENERLRQELESVRAELVSFKECDRD